MLEISLIIIVILLIINILISFFKKTKIESIPQLQDIEKSIIKVETNIGRIETLTKDEFQRIRTEANNISKDNRLELIDSMNNFGDQLSKNITELSQLLRQEFIAINKQQNEFNKQITESDKSNREELSISLKSFEDSFTKNTKELNTLLNDKFTAMNKQQNEFNKQITESDKSNREELSISLKSFEDSFTKNTKELNTLLNDKFTAMNKQQNEFNKQTIESDKSNRDELSISLKSFESQFIENTKNFNDLLRQKFTYFSEQQSEISRQTTSNVKEIKDSVEKQLKTIREDNTRQLEEMRQTVDEKLQKTLNERLSQSFETVGKQLQAVQEGLGEMRNLATDVGGLKKVLSNVKMRGNIGEIQLEMLLEQILAPEQYEANVKTKASSSDLVEFAIKLPGRGDYGDTVWLPIDAKFPKETYEQIIEAFEEGDTNKIKKTQKNMENVIKKMAKDIRDKYIDPPHTTDFGIMFLPFEGIYAEVVRNTALVETIQRDYKIIVTGPTTLAAILNSLQMGFKTLAIQKRSSEVWQVLGAVKKEFGNFGDLMGRAQKNIRTGLNQLDNVMGVRTRAIQRKLRSVEVLSEAESKKILPEIAEQLPLLETKEEV